LRTKAQRSAHAADDWCRPDEKWLPVPGYEGHYEVSDMGRVRSLDREVLHADGVLHRKCGRVLRPWIGAKNGYPCVSLKMNGKRTGWCVHRLVALAFLGNPANGHEVCHSNGDRSDARLGNLRWDTHSANMCDRRKDGTDHNVAKTHCPRDHRLAGPNIQRARDSASRHCKACARARAKFGRSTHPAFKAESDRQYRRIMGDAA